ncbi:MAG: hypothetical protein VX589_12465 [Myxococcota bacterium]|nr:hypothetical protein [Myxococcota bacterium]
MIRVLVFLIFGSLSACVPRTIVSDYQPTVAKDVVRAWADAYNRGKFQQLILLVHPQKRADFEAGDTGFRAQMKGWMVKSYLVGASVRINNEFAGHEVSYQLTDGRRTRQVDGIIVQEMSRWWIWRF